MKLTPGQLVSELQKVENNNYQRFVKKIRLSNVRGFQDEEIEFRSPVTALIGTNGGGKSTIIGALALAYKNTKPRNFFPKASFGDETMANWVIEYDLVDKEIANDRLVQRTARFSQAKWRRDSFPSRPIEYVEIQRTVPASELARFRKFISGPAGDYDIVPLSQQTIRFATAVLDKDIQNYRVVVNRGNRSERMYVGSVGEGVEYSQFHFGAGEASIIETIDRIESADNNSLILIEEVENGLHPVAVRLMVHYLQNAAMRKRLQVVFTTHSQDAVNELPPKSVWACISNKTWNGKLTIESLRAITGQVPDARAIFVEDEFAKEWVSNAVGRFLPDLQATTKVFAAGGYPNCVKVAQFHNENPMINAPAVALVDGDIYDPETSGALPAHARFIGEGYPEAIIFDYIFDNRAELASVIRQRCLLSAYNEDRILQDIESVRNSGCDPHLVFQELSARLDYASALYIRAGMIDLFNERNPEFWQEITEFIRESTGDA